MLEVGRGTPLGFRLGVSLAAAAWTASGASLPHAVDGLRRPPAPRLDEPAARAGAIVEHLSAAGFPPGSRTVAS